MTHTDGHLSACVFNIGPLFAWRLGAITNRLLYQLSYLGPVVIKGLTPSPSRNLASNLRCSRRVSPMCYSRQSKKRSRIDSNLLGILPQASWVYTLSCEIEILLAGTSALPRFPRTCEQPIRHRVLLQSRPCCENDLEAMDCAQPTSEAWEALNKLLKRLAWRHLASQEIALVGN